MSSKMKRTKSVGPPVKLQPAVTKEARERAEALKRVYQRPKTALRNSRPETANYNLPPLLNGRLSSAVNSRMSAGSMIRSKSESRGLTRMEYGRSASREHLDDLRDELHHAKKKVAVMETEKKKLQTQMHRVLRDSEKRERFLERLITSKFQPAELNDTHIARTLAGIQRNELSREQIIRIQAKELEKLRNNMSDTYEKSDISKPSSSGINGYESDFTEASDYPEEPEPIKKTNGILKTTKPVDKKTKNRATVTSDVGRIEPETRPLKETDKIKRKLELAKAYAEQNAKLKERLKELKNNYMEIQQRNKKKEEEMKKHTQNAREVVEKTGEVASDYQKLIRVKEEEFNQEKTRNAEMIEELHQELREAYGEIDALRMENEHLHNVISDMETKVDPAATEHGGRNVIKIPKLDMTHMDSNETQSQALNSASSTPLSFTELDMKLLAKAIGEIISAHVERERALHRY